MNSKFARFMLGRRGPDQFCFGLIIFSIIISLLGGIFFSRLKLIYFIFRVVSFGAMAFAIYRFLSKKISDREKENIWFLSLYIPAKRWVLLQYNKIKERKTHVYFKCPKCKAELRVPKGVGKIQVVCKKCGEKFTRTC